MPRFWPCVPAAVFWVASLAPSPVQAALVYLSVPSITGEDAVPGHPGTMAVQSLTVAPDFFSVVKRVDRASPMIFNAVLSGAPLGTAGVFLYNSPPTGPADVTLSFPDVRAVSYRTLGGAVPLEQDGFRSTTPASLYLEVPGIMGESSLPGHPGVLRVQSFSLAGHELSVVRDVDKLSPQFFQDALRGTGFSTARLLLYDSAPTGPPDVTLVFRDPVASSYQLLAGVGAPQEQDGFHFSDVLPASPAAAPEPSSLTLLGIGAFGLAVAARRRRRG